MNDLQTFWMPTKPSTIEQAINRRAAAQGSPRVAQLAQGSNYMGHHNSVTWNDYRGYYVGEYPWAGRNVFYRGTNVRDAIEAGKRAYNQQGAGAVLRLVPHTEADQAVMALDPDLQPWSKEIEEAHHEATKTWKHNHVCDIVDYMGGVNQYRLQLLLTTDSEEVYLEQRYQVGKEWQARRNEQLAREFDQAIKNI